jgi:hypothetical protein
MRGKSKRSVMLHFGTGHSGQSASPGDYRPIVVEIDPVSPLLARIC